MSCSIWRTIYWKMSIDNLMKSEKNKINCDSQSEISKYSESWSDISNIDSRSNRSFSKETTTNYTPRTQWRIQRINPNKTQHVLIRELWSSSWSSSHSLGFRQTILPYKLWNNAWTLQSKMRWCWLALKLVSLLNFQRSNSSELPWLSFKS